MEVAQSDSMEEPNQEIQVDFLGPLTGVWGANKYLSIFVDRFSKFSSTVQVTTHTTATVIREFLEN